ncbi:MAG: hypothetical protein FD129_2373, partial [bacterium]
MHRAETRYRFIAPHDQVATRIVDFNADHPDIRRRKTGDRAMAQDPLQVHRLTGTIEIAIAVDHPVQVGAGIPGAAGETEVPRLEVPVAAECQPGLVVGGRGDGMERPILPGDVRQTGPGDETIRAGRAGPDQFSARGPHFHAGPGHRSGRGEAGQPEEMIRSGCLGGEPEVGDAEQRTGARRRHRAGRSVREGGARTREVRDRPGRVARFQAHEKHAAPTRAEGLVGRDEERVGLVPGGSAADRSEQLSVGLAATGVSRSADPVRVAGVGAANVRIIPGSAAEHAADGRRVQSHHREARFPDIREDQGNLATVGALD